MIYLYQRVLYKRGLFLLEGGFLTVKQPYNTTIYNTALYLRLSRDDELQGESGSIQTQRMMLRQYAACPVSYTHLMLLIPIALLNKDFFQ